MPAVRSEQKTLGNRLLAEISDEEWTILCNRKHAIDARLARWLLMSSDGVGGDDLAITHEFLAAMLGVRRSGVTEAAVKLQDEGLIQYKRGGVRIIDRRKLESAACECYQNVRNEFERLFHS